jgi:general secretion pathway protein A
MFLDFYALSGQPFQLTPDARFFFKSRSHARALSYLTYGLHQAEGFIVITGEVGAGKTTIVEQLLSTLDKDRYVASRVVTTQLDAGDLIRMVAVAFGLSDAGEKASLLRRLEEHFQAVRREGKRALLVIDEVQNLPIEALEELRMLSNYQLEGAPLLQSFLVGQPQFRPTLASEHLEQLRQRVIATYHLGPMDADDCRQYIEHRLTLVSWRNDPEFTDDAFRLIQEKTQGIPRKINTLCTRLLLFGCLEQRHQIDAEAVEAVMSDLLQEGAAGGFASSTPIAQPVITVPAPSAAKYTALQRQISEFEELLERQNQTKRWVFEAGTEFLKRLNTWIESERLPSRGP